MLFKDYHRDALLFFIQNTKSSVAENVNIELLFIRFMGKENYFENHLALKSYLYLSAPE